MCVPFGKFLQLIIRYCSPNQFRTVKLRLGHCGMERTPTDLPMHFRNVEKFELENRRIDMYMTFSESLGFLRLTGINLKSTFDWTELTSLTDLFLKEVHGINVPNFIDFLRHRPKLERFASEKTFEDSNQDVYEVIAQFCGDQIQICCIHNDMFYEEIPQAFPANFHNFISGFKNVKRLSLAPHQICGGDLIDPMCRLAENNTIEELLIMYDSYYDSYNENCILNIHERFEMKSLKTLRIELFLNTLWEGDNLIRLREGCDVMKLLTVYSSQILSNVEILMIVSDKMYNCDFIEFAPKLRELIISGYLKSDETIKIVSMLENIQKNRNNGDVIEVKFDERREMKAFAEICGRNNSSIKLSLLNDRLKLFIS